MRISFRSLLAAILFCLAATATAAERPRFGFAVICDDPALAQVLRAGIEARFHAARVDIADKLPTAKLFVYANRDSGDRKNPEGVSIAIAHVSNMPTAVLALSYVKRQDGMPEEIRAMLGEEGFLQHLNVAHMDTPSDTQVNEVLDKLVSTFLSKYPAQ
ncbi:hypothetical protein [Massilia aerilata]|uniref:Uncharacterized protein n=1 Tax=Massilia aerilata TaxID=453817 RepID=A0ABW0S1E6_9BURK